MIRPSLFAFKEFMTANSLTQVVFGIPRIPSERPNPEYVLALDVICALPRGTVYRDDIVCPYNWVNLRWESFHISQILRLYRRQ